MTASRIDEIPLSQPGEDNYITIPSLRWDDITQKLMTYSENLT